ncbi:MCP four helix bundle domain-containing protein [Spirulina subsalsa FACHB-351]|uniref:MCP four helix bundle domain-containing protein n=1 Tax=Spirulina subsalsa FACHB-351 TaxID=234711 RepID=A0ABT3L9R7_9CYAN|nr:methyl-accepting chemotaxis protein [Spirulina subsalsa]MCW6038235.1 MCP four helix bundle domain-containing protein [Spirulina subsalsa FACHB-351]
MFNKSGLQVKLIGSFSVMGLIVLIVAGMGWFSVQRLNQVIQTFTEKTLPSVSGLWKVNEGTTQIQSSERMLLYPGLEQEDREQALTRIRTAWQQIEEGLAEYQATPRTPEEEQSYQRFLANWEGWKQAHQEFLTLENSYHNLGLTNPWEAKLNALNQSEDIQNQQIVQADSSIRIWNQVNRQQKDKKRPLFDQISQELLDLIEVNQELSQQAQTKAALEERFTLFWSLIGVFVAPLIAVILGVVLSKMISKPLLEVIQTIASSVRQLSVNIEEQERVLSAQSASVNETTTTIHQLEVASNQSAEQANQALKNAEQVLSFAQVGGLTVGETLTGITQTAEDVQTIVERIDELNQKLEQVNVISALVTDIAIQTNMLALNASVEAIRAQAEGRGFGVVAAEIRKLADQSKESAAKITTLIGETQRVMQPLLKSIEMSKTNAIMGIQLSKQTADAFQSVSQSVTDVIATNQQIALTAQQQAKAIEMVMLAMNNINQGAQETVVGISQTQGTVQLLNQVALILQDLGGQRS